MSDEKAESKENGRTEGLLENDLAAEIVEVKVPPKSKYLPLLRAAVGVVAGGLALDYDEILELRVAVSEAFGLVIRHIDRDDTLDESTEIVTAFVIASDRLVVLVSDPGYRPGNIGDSEEIESRVVLESLVDSVEMGAEVRGHRVIRLVKRRPTEEELL